MRQFIAETPLDSKGCLKIEGKKFHYLQNVLRVKPGDMIDVRLTDGTLQPMTVACIDKAEKQITLQTAGSIVGRQNESSANNAAADEISGTSSALHAAALQTKPVTQIYLFQFAAKPAKMEQIVRQATECGTAYIIPVEGKFSQSGSIKSAKEAAQKFTKGGRWDRIITEARQQCGSATDTKVLPSMTVAEAAAFWKKETEGEEKSLAVVLYEQTKNTMLLHKAAKNADKINKAAIAVGAEGGISPEEIEILMDSGFIPVHFETNILRCETAALYGIAALQTVLTEQNVWQSRE